MTSCAVPSKNNIDLRTKSSCRLKLKRSIDRVHDLIWSLIQTCSCPHFRSGLWMDFRDKDTNLISFLRPLRETKAHHFSFQRRIQNNRLANRPQELASPLGKPGSATAFITLNTNIPHQMSILPIQKWRAQLPHLPLNCTKQRRLFFCQMNTYLFSSQMLVLGWQCW